MFGETESKYLAGLLDADGSLSFVHNNGYLSLMLHLSMSESIDKDGRYAKYLGSKVGKLHTRERDDNWAIQNEWVIYSRNDHEKTLPHVIKHMVVKGKKWSFMLEKLREYKAAPISKEQFALLREEANLLRGPLKAKKHPTWAWTAGYIDGDGWYLKRERGSQIEQHVGVVSHRDHLEGLELLHKAFGGVLKEDRGYYRWIKNLGPRDKQFTIAFLKKMVNHSQLKKWKIEQLLSTYSQRLSVLTPTGDAIV
jgi:intein/homing endonuclease